MCSVPGTLSGRPYYCERNAGLFLSVDWSGSSLEDDSVAIHDASNPYSTDQQTWNAAQELQHLVREGPKEAGTRLSISELCPIEPLWTEGLALTDSGEDDTATKVFGFLPDQFALELQSEFTGYEDVFNKTCTNTQPLWSSESSEYGDPIFIHRSTSPSSSKSILVSRLHIDHQPSQLEVSGTRPGEGNAFRDHPWSAAVRTEVEGPSVDLPGHPISNVLFMLDEKTCSANAGIAPAPPHRPSDLLHESPRYVQRKRSSQTGRRGAYGAAKRNKVNAVRVASACIRCQMLKEPCNETALDEYCTRCIEIGPSAKVWRMPCVRARITDVNFFRTGAIRFPLGVRKITTWMSSEVKTLQLHFDSPSVPIRQIGPSLTVACRRFYPIPGDVLCKKYPTSTGTVILQLPNYALSSLPVTVRSLDAYVENNFSYFANEIMDGPHPLHSLTFGEALRHDFPGSVVREALTICIITRLCCRSFGLAGRERLGIAEVTDIQSPYFGKVPIPPILDAQIDELWTANMMKRRKFLLSKLKANIFARKPEKWLETFLTVFAILSNLEYCYKQKCNQLRRHITADSPSPVFSFATQSMIQGWEAGAENILAHFRAINGTAPLCPRWLTEDNVARSGLDTESIQYLNRISQMCALDRE